MIIPNDYFLCYEEDIILCNRMHEFLLLLSEVLAMLRKALSNAYTLMFSQVTEEFWVAYKHL